MDIKYHVCDIAPKYEYVFLPLGARQVSEMGNIFLEIAKFTLLKAYYVPGTMSGGTGGVMADSQWPRLPLHRRIPKYPQGLGLTLSKMFGHTPP